MNCTNADQVMIPHISLAGLVSSKKHNLATFVHEKLRSAPTERSSEGSAIEWLCMDVAGYQIVNVCKPLTLRLILTAIPVFPHSCLYVDDFNC